MKATRSSTWRSTTDGSFRARRVGRADGSGNRNDVRSAVKSADASSTGLYSKIGTVPMVVTGTYNPHLVALSILVAAFAAYTALDLGGRVSATRGAAPRVWLVAAAIAMGGGIWSMHFIGMLAFNL